MDSQQLALRSGYEVNRQGGFYVRGRPYNTVKKLEVADDYQRQSRGGTIRPNMSAIARRNRVSNTFVNRIKAELIAHGRVLSPAEVRANRVFPRGPGALSLDKFDQFTLMQLFYDEPERSLRSYRQWLEYYTGAIVSRATISV